MKGRNNQKKQAGKRTVSLKLRVLKVEERMCGSGEQCIMHQ